MLRSPSSRRRWHAIRRGSNWSALGRGRPVLVVPGFGFGDPSTVPLQWALHTAGYRVVRSGIWVNVGCSDRAVDALAEVARRTVEADGGRRLFVVGHSRGGMLARGLALVIPSWWSGWSAWAHR